MVEVRFDGEFGELVELARESRGMTQASLANMAGISWTVIAEIESGDYTPSAEQAEAIREVLGLMG